MGYDAALPIGRLASLYNLVAGTQTMTLRFQSPSPYRGDSAAYREMLFAIIVCPCCTGLAKASTGTEVWPSQLNKHPLKTIYLETG